ncbi:hypothetical protein [Hyalangium rubrum]|uniref:Uncharacterized protein n=1 Tax=Hyalangium rubrum TaxID=3103134 RepID=A0ABU5GV44_9BACT|nr:hypothetical protein [Hyalangium sp. s54d21]MDY7224911.1 hypothetical protein [Hyalangium sp. s54d21]
MRLAIVLLTLAASSALAQGTPSAQAKAGANSTITVRCMDDCSVRLDGKAGMRKDPRTWEFKDVAPGQRRVEATGGFLNRSLYNGYADVPAGMRVMAQISSSNRLTITESKPLTEEKEAKVTGTTPSVLTMRCPKQCTVSVDGARKGAGQSQLVVVRDLPPGEHTIEVKFVLGTKMVRSQLDIPAGSEVFATATEGGITITNSKPLGK